ncbi:MAG: UvrD-helicase domain-containing protein, partial [Eubacteriales bacterium]|nr:UvrD-helicase domain-containing protein [Eubacteriales bacterium]
ALRALGDPGVGEAIRARFSHVFVDEYQDVSDLQEALIVKVAREGNLFMVGDVKQSIYRFRQAEPTLFIEKYHRYGKGAGGRLIALSHNFRSRPGILALVNRIFERAMSGPDAETPYDDAARLRPGAAFADAEPPIELHLIAPDSKEDSERAELSKAEREGALVAARIRALLLETLPAGDARRPVRPRDIAVIARTRSALAACERMLREAGIPAYADVDGGYFDALEVRIMLSLLELIENRRRDYPLLAVLRSPIGGLTSTELAQVRAARPEGSFRDAMIEYLPRGDETAAKLRALEEDLDRWRALSRALPLGEFVDLLLRETGFYASAGAMPGGAARQGNLDLLCAYASDFEAAQGGGLTGFLSYVAEVAATGGDLSAAHALGAGDDVVRLMTAHKSKGLEFPIVLAIQLGRSLSARQNAGELKTHRQLGAGLYHHDPTLATRRETIARRAIRLAGEREALEEETRILYVLLTRAQHRLILVGSQDALGAARRRWEAARRAPIAPQSFLDMIVPALPEMGEAPEIQVTWHEGVRPEGPARAHEAESPPTPAEVRSAIDALSWRYPHEGEAFLPVKLTVSGLSRSLEGAHEAPPMVRRPRFLSGEHATALERGTLIHAAMSALDLRALAARQGALLRAELTGQLKALEKRGVLREAVDPEPIARFFGRELGRRLLAAETVRREWPFNLRMAAREALLVDSDAELMVQGVVDCCFLEDGAWVLLDYKTDRLDDEDAMSKRYGAQLTLYRRALERITGIPVKEVLLCLLGAGRELPVG